MPVDPSIYGNIRLPQPIPDPIQQYGQAMQLKGLLRNEADDEAIRTAYQESGGDPDKLKSALYGSGQYKQAVAAEKARLETTKTTSDIMKNDIDLIKKFRDESDSLWTTLNPENWKSFRDEQIARAGTLSMPENRKIAIREVLRMPEVFDQSYIDARIKAKQAQRGESFRLYPTAEGYVEHDERRGGLRIPSSPGGQRAIPAQHDPVLRGKVKAAEANAAVVGKDVADIGRGKDSLTSISEARDMLDKGIYTGSYANIKKGLAKWTPGVDTERAANTEAYLSHIGNVVIPRLKDFGGNDTVEEMKYLQEVLAGRITLEEKAIRNILDSAERKLNAKIKRLAKQARPVDLEDRVLIDADPDQPTAPKLTRDQIDQKLKNIDKLLRERKAFK